GCSDDGSGNFGQCAANGSCPASGTPSGNAAKVDCSTSNLTSPIGSGATRCSYCYGNSKSVVAANLPRLPHPLRPGLDTRQEAANTATIHFALQNDQNHNVTITVRYAVPAVDVPGTQLTYQVGSETLTCGLPGANTVLVHGAGFGPPSSCLGALPLAGGSCPL